MWPAAGRRSDDAGRGGVQDEALSLLTALAWLSSEYLQQEDPYGGGSGEWLRERRVVTAAA